MPSMNSITRTVRLQKSDVRIIEEYMERYGISFNNAVHTIINEKNTERQLNIGDFIDLSGSVTDDHGKLRSEFDCMRASLPKLLGTVCRKCGSDKGVEYHHIKPLRYGGTNELSNIVPLCQDCHNAIHGRAVRDNAEIDKLKAENEKLKKKIDALKKALVALGEE